MVKLFRRSNKFFRIEIMKWLNRGSKKEVQFLDTNILKWGTDGSSNITISPFNHLKQFFDILGKQD